MSCWAREPPGILKTIKAVAININCPPELGGKTLLLKTLHALRYREIKQN